MDKEIALSINKETHVTTSVVILSRELPRKILLVYHKKSNKWVFPGGHIETGENPIEAGIREVNEETGIDISAYMPSPTRINDEIQALPLPQYFFEERIDKHSGSPAHHHLDIVYVVTIPFQPPHHSARWYDINDLGEIPLFENAKQVIYQLLSRPD